MKMSARKRWYHEFRVYRTRERLELPTAAGFSSRYVAVHAARFPIKPAGSLVEIWRDNRFYPERAVDVKRYMRRNWLA